jgi:hypothetical protein
MGRNHLAGPARDAANAVLAAAGYNFGLLLRWLALLLRIVLKVLAAGYPNRTIAASQLQLLHGRRLKEVLPRKPDISNGSIGCSHQSIIGTW